MEAEWFAQRAALRCLTRQHPEWTQAEFAAYLGRSRSWVKKWRARLKAHAPDDLAVLHARSRARHTPQPTTPPVVVERILSLRDDPPEHWRRVPGPKAILYFLPRDPQAQALGVRLPRSTRTKWRDPAPTRTHRRGSAPAASPVGATSPSGGSADGL